jgi:hypothetical protein
MVRATDVTGIPTTSARSASTRFRARWRVIPLGAAWCRGTIAVTWIGFGDPDQSPQSHAAE